MTAHAARRYRQRINPKATYGLAMVLTREALTKGTIVLDTGECQYILSGDLILTAERVTDLDYYDYVISTVLPKDMEVFYTK